MKFYAEGSLQVNSSSFPVKNVLQIKNTNRKLLADTLKYHLNTSLNYYYDIDYLNLLEYDAIIVAGEVFLRTSYQSFYKEVEPFSSSTDLFRFIAEIMDIPFIIVTSGISEECVTSTNISHKINENKYIVVTSQKGLREAAKRFGLNKDSHAYVFVEYSEDFNPIDVYRTLSILEKL